MKRYCPVTNEQMAILADRVGDAKAEFIFDFLDFWSCELKKLNHEERWRLKKHYGSRVVYINFYNEMWSWSALVESVINDFFRKKYAAFCEQVVKDHKKKALAGRVGKAKFFHEFVLAFELIMEDIQPGFTKEALI